MTERLARPATRISAVFLCGLLGFTLLHALSADAAAQDLRTVLVAESDRSFARPHDLALSPDGRYLYVSDVGNDAVKVLDPETLETLGAFGQRELSSPHDVAFHPDGRLLVADSGNDRIALYRVDGTGGTFLGALSERMASPEGVAAAGDGTIYVTNAARHTVLAIRDGAILAAVGTRGDGANEYVRPHDIDVGPDGRLYAVDPGNNRIQILTPALDHAGSLGSADFAFNEPKYIAFDDRGWLYVADEYNNQVKIFDGDRRLRSTIGSGRRGDGPGELNQPEGVAVRGERVWVSDTYNGRILLFRLERAP